MSCSQCQGIERVFDSKLARRELRFYRWFGPRKSTALLLQLLEPLATSKSLLDIGGGIGVIQHELYRSGLHRSMQVDGASAYIKVSREESRRRGHENRCEYRHGDFVDLAAEDVDIKADLVSLDRVICCYPGMEELLGAAADRASRVVGLVFPRDGRLFQIIERVGNLFVRFFDPDYRMYIHSAKDVEDLMRNRGFSRKALRKTVAWQVHLYERVAH